MSPLLLVLLAASPEVAVLSTRPADGFTELRFPRLGAAELSAPVARFEHLDDATALGALIPGTRKVLATATVERGDTSFASALVLLEENRPTRVLAEQVAVANRPLVTSTGRIFIQRGVAGPVLTPEASGPKPRQASMRVDDLRVDEIRLDAEPRTVFATRGYTAFLAGSFGSELIVYRVGPDGAELLAVNVDTLKQRLVTRLEPLARDFVVDEPGHRVVFTLGDPRERSWHVVSVDLLSGELSTLGTSKLPALLPFVVGGKVVFNTGPGPRFDHLRFVTSAGIRVGLTERPSDFPLPFAIDPSGKRLELAAVPGARLDLAGVTR